MAIKSNDLIGKVLGQNILERLIGADGEARNNLVISTALCFS